MTSGAWLCDGAGTSWTNEWMALGYELGARAYDALRDETAYWLDVRWGPVSRSLIYQGG